MGNFIKITVSNELLLLRRRSICYVKCDQDNGDIVISTIGTKDKLHLKKELKAYYLIKLHLEENLFKIHDNLFINLGAITMIKTLSSGVGLVVFRAENSLELTRLECDKIVEQLNFRTIAIDC